MRVAPRTTELLLERGRFVPGQGVPLFELRPPTFAGAEWATKRVFDIVIASVIVVLGAPIWLLTAAAIKLSSRGPVFYADPRIGLGEHEFRMLKFRTMIAGADQQQGALEARNEAGGVLFKIRDDPRLTPPRTLFCGGCHSTRFPTSSTCCVARCRWLGPRPLPLATTSGWRHGTAAGTNVLPGSDRPLAGCPAAPTSRSTTSSGSTSTTSRTGRSGSTCRSC